MARGEENPKMCYSQSLNLDRIQHVLIGSEVDAEIEAAININRN